MTEIPRDGSCTQMDPREAEKFFIPDTMNEHSARTKMAKRICANCVVLNECRDFGMENLFPFGIFGGMTPNERYRLAEREQE